jgi:hypothetical protein
MVSEVDFSSFNLTAGAIKFFLKFFLAWGAFQNQPNLLSW